MLAPPLSTRQSEIADLVAIGKSNRQIAESLALSPRTVETHVAAIFNKYGISTRVALAVARLGSRPGDGAAMPPAARTNLPHPRGELIGRDEHVADLVRRLGEARLVTVVGPGGVGKTSVAELVGRRLHADGRDVAFVELAPLADGSFVARAVATALDVRVARDEAALDGVVATVADRATLVVLDNCEHLVADAASYADALMRACPNVRILATSREPLRLFGEHTYRLPSLRVPTAVEASSLHASEGRSYAAIALFASRARAADRTFSLDDGNVRTIGDIVRRLDGIPLALELAAARVTVLSIETLASKLDMRLHLLRNVDRSVDARHQTMRALVDWSYDLLTLAERRLLERLSVFVGGWGLHEATAVYGDPAGDEMIVLELLSSLVDKSLVVADFSLRESRYTLLETVRHFARERLAERGEADVVTRRHATAMADLAERLNASYVPTPEWFSHADRELGNFRTAIDATLGRGIDVELGQRIVAAIKSSDERDHEHWRWIVLAREFETDRTAPSLVARLRLAHAGTAYRTGRHELALELALQASEALAAVDDEVGVAIAYSVAALAHLMLGRIALARPFVDRARATARRHPATSWAAGVEHSAAKIAFANGDSIEGRTCLGRARTIYESIGAFGFAAQLSVSLAEYEFDAGDAGRAMDVIGRALPVLREQGSTITLSWAQCNAAAYAIALGRWADARAWAADALALARSVRWKAAIAYALQHLAAISIATANATSIGHSPENVARVIGFIDAALARDEMSRQPNEAREYEAIVAALHRSLAEDALAELYAEGARATLDEICALAEGRRA